MLVKGGPGVYLANYYWILFSLSTTSSIYLSMDVPWLKIWKKILFISLVTMLLSHRWQTVPGRHQVQYCTNDVEHILWKFNICEYKHFHEIFYNALNFILYKYMNITWILPMMLCRFIAVGNHNDGRRISALTFSIEIRNQMCQWTRLQ